MLHKKNDSGELSLKGFRVQGSGGGFAAFLMTVFPYRQPSPRGEGTPKGRIGHWRYERQMKKTEKCAAYVGKRESLKNDKDFSLRLK